MRFLAALGCEVELEPNLIPGTAPEWFLQLYMVKAALFFFQAIICNCQAFVQLLYIVLLRCL